VIAWYAKSLTSGRVNASREYTVVPSFSTIKVLLAAAFWRAVAAGELREARPYAFQPWQSVGGAGVLRGFRHAARLTLADYLHLALVVSDNDATNVVIAFLGFDRVNALAAELGLAATALQRPMMDWESAAAGRDNVTCARDLAALLEMLVRGDPRVGAAACEKVRASLALQEHRDGLPRGLPAGATYAGKPGDDLPEGRFCHDCGVITTPAGETLVLAVLTDGEGGYDTISGAGRRLYDELTAE
jgi:beta-lactamase class A